MNFETMDLASFRIILPPSRNISMSELRISPTKLIFSPVAVADLNYAKDVCLLFSEEEQKILVSPSEKTHYTLPFLPENVTGPIKALPIGHTAIVKALRSHMHWASKGTYRITGIRIPDTSYLAFDLTTASCGTRRMQKMDPEKFLASCPKIADIHTQNTTFAPILALPETAIIC